MTLLSVACVSVVRDRIVRMAHLWRVAMPSASTESDASTEFGASTESDRATPTVRATALANTVCPVSTVCDETALHQTVLHQTALSSTGHDGAAHDKAPRDKAPHDEIGRDRERHKQQRILHLLGSFRLPPDPDQAGSSGVVRAALELARQQASDGHQVTVACVGDSAWQSTWHGVTLRSFRPVPWARLQLLGRGVDLSWHMPFVLFTLRRRFDVVHGHLYYYLRGLRAGVRIAHVHGDPLHKSMGTQTTGMTAKTFALLERTVDGFIAVSQFIAGRLRHGLPDSDRIHVVYNGVNFDNFTMSETDRAAKRAHWREQWGVTPQDTVYVYVGAIVPEKGVLHLARAFATIEQERSDVHLVIVGSSSLWGTSKQAQDPNAMYEQHVREALEGALARGHAHFIGKVPAPQVAASLAASDVFVMPSVWQEPFGLVILEAFAAGLPVIASKVGGIPEVAAYGFHWLVPAEEDALRDAMRLVAQSELRYVSPLAMLADATDIGAIDIGATDIGATDIGESTDVDTDVNSESVDTRLHKLKTALAWERASVEVLEVYDAIRMKKAAKAARS